MKLIRKKAPLHLTIIGKIFYYLYVIDKDGIKFRILHPLYLVYFIFIFGAGIIIHFINMIKEIIEQLKENTCLW